jgi:hypothetical protein
VEGRQVKATALVPTDSGSILVHFGNARVRTSVPARSREHMEVCHLHHREMLITGELYYQLRLAGIEAYLETRLPSHVHSSGFMRVDIAAFDEDGVFAAIEAKKEGGKLGPMTRQAKAYRGLRDLGVGILFVSQEADIAKTVALVVALKGARNERRKLLQLG